MYFLSTDGENVSIRDVMARNVTAPTQAGIVTVAYTDRCGKPAFFTAHVSEHSHYRGDTGENIYLDYMTAIDMKDRMIRSMTDERALLSVMEAHGVGKTAARRALDSGDPEAYFKVK